MLSGGLDAREVSPSPGTAVTDAPRLVRRAPHRPGDSRHGTPRRSPTDAPVVPDEFDEFDEFGEPDDASLRPVDWLAIVGTGVLLASGALWLRSVSGVEQGSMDELGLISTLPVTFLVAVGLLTAGFVVLLARPSRHGTLLAAYVATFALLAHATGAVRSGSLSGSSAWADIGVVDHLRRTGDLPAAGALASPTEWPGFVALTALLTDVSGVAPATVAAWMPLGFTLVALLGVWVICRALTPDPRVAWAATWLFVLGTWVGLATPSPLAAGSTLAVALLAVALPLDRTHGTAAVLPDNIGPSGSTVASLGAAVGFLALVGLALVSTDPTSGAVAAAVLVVAAATGTSRTWWLATGLALATTVWLLGPAWSVVGDDALAWLDPAGAPAQFATSSTGPLSALSGGAQLVLIAGRFLAEATVVLAVIGIVAARRSGRRVGFLVGAASVGLLALVGGVDTHTLFLAFALALPWLAVAGAFALGGPSAHRSAGLALRLIVVGVLTAGFVVAQSGERGAGYFTPDEVQLVTGLTAGAPAPTLIIEGSSNSPAGARSVDQVRRVSLADDSEATLDALAADPEATLHARLVAADGDGFAGAFILLTRSQRHGELIAPRLPDGLLVDIESALRASDRFVVVAENADAIAFTKTDGGS